MQKEKLFELPNGDWILPSTITGIRFYQKYTIGDEAHKRSVIIDKERGQNNVDFNSDDEAKEFIKTLAVKRDGVKSCPLYADYEKSCEALKARNKELNQST